MKQETKEKTMGILLGIIGGVALAAYLEHRYKIHHMGFKYSYKIVILYLLLALFIFLCWAFLAWSGKI
jgi:uncharacterized membrane protein YsdA (DUF1294 family)